MYYSMLLCNLQSKENVINDAPNECSDEILCRCSIAQTNNISVPPEVLLIKVILLDWREF